MTKTRPGGHEGRKRGSMNINRKTVSISYWAVDDGLYQIKKALMRTKGLCLDDASIIMAPLYWYVGTGRASLDFLRALLNAKPYMIARKLYEGGADEEVIQRIRAYLQEE